MSIKAYKNRVVPCPCKREWTWMLDEQHIGCLEALNDNPDFEGCRAIACQDCIYSSNPQRAEYYKECFPEKTKKLPKRDSQGRFCKEVKALPKLTVEVFNKPNCPKWAQWAAVDADGIAVFYEEIPILGGSRWFDRGENSHKVHGGLYDASDWEHSLIERPQKELPELTQTAFHCPDCPKEATKLKVFPANHVVALDKDDKVLSVMELQCQEGEVNKPKADWYYAEGPDRFYFKADAEDIPATAQPVCIRFLTPGFLRGRAVTNQNTGKTSLSLRWRIN